MAAAKTPRIELWREYAPIGFPVTSSGSWSLDDASDLERIEVRNIRYISWGEGELMVNCFTKYARQGSAIHIAMLSLACAMPAVAQPTSTEQQVNLIVAGRVEQVFRDGDDFLVQILVQSAEAPFLDAGGAIRYPAPGQFAYVHVDAGDLPGRIVRTSRGPAVPNPNSSIRARLSAGKSGRWLASGRDWFDANPNNGRSNNPVSLEQQAVSFGVEVERVFVRGESGLKVNRVRPGSPAAKAGIEPGDVIMKAAGASLESQAQLEDAFRASRGVLNVTVRDIRSGREARVDVEASGIPAVRTNPSAATLGVMTETAFYGGEAALKVTRVDPNSLAQQAGMSSGLLILKVDGRSIGKPDELQEVVQRSRGQIELVIVDPKDRRERTIRIRL